MAAGAELGVMHFIGHTDAIGKALFGILLLMSMTSWYWIIVKWWVQLARARRSRVFLTHFWNSTSLDSVEQGLAELPLDEPFSQLTRGAFRAHKHHAEYGVARLEDVGSSGEYLTRALRKGLDAETARLESGLTVLASIASTAPFIGLFGTVWGIYHALLKISAEGSGSLDKVAGPVGEALIMTALGLAVAIPAVLAFNTLNRSNRVLLTRLDAFAHELFTFMSTGASLDPREKRRA